MLLTSFRAAIAAFIIALFGLSPAFAQDASEADYQAKLKLLQKNIQQVQKQLESVKGSRQELLRELQKNETETAELIKKIEAIKAELQKEEQALGELKQRRGQLAQEQARGKKQVARQLRTAYLLGGQSDLKLLLSQDDPYALSRLLMYHDYFLDAHLQQLSSYAANLRELDSIEPRIVASTQNLENQRKTLESRRHELESKQAERARTLARLDDSIRSKDEELQQLARDREHVEALLTQIVATIGDVGRFNGDAPFAELKGKLAWPTPGRIAQRFGSDRVAGKLKWDGVVIAAEEGAPVRAVHHGRVVFADYLRGHGLLIIVDHGEGFMSLYAHNQSLNKRVGNWVEAGEVIATVGNTGGQSSAALYFEIRHNGKPTNPGGWCA